MDFSKIGPENYDRVHASEGFDHEKISMSKCYNCFIDSNCIYQVFFAKHNLGPWNLFNKGKKMSSILEDVALLLGQVITQINIRSNIRVENN